MATGAERGGGGAPRRQRWRTLALAVGALALAVPTAVAGPAALPVGADTTQLTLQRTLAVPLATTYPTTGTSEYYSSPALADLDGDSSPELVVAAPNGTVTATRLSDGVRLWQANLGRTTIHASPVVDDIDGNGTNEVVVGTMTGFVFVLNGRSGAKVRQLSQGAPQFCSPGVDCRPDGFFGTPAIGDVNGDGRKDIVASSYDHSVYAWSSGGTLLWRSFLEDSLWSSPAIVDIDRNGRNEVVLGGDIYAGNPLRVPAGGLLWALNGANGTRVSGYPISIPGQTVWSSPAIGDINGDGRIDAVFGTGSNFPSSATTRRVYAYTLTTRQPVPGWPVAVPGQVLQQPAIGDVDDDGVREVVVATEGGYVIALEPDGSTRWSTCNSTLRTNCPIPATHNGAAVADVDDDGVQEVIATNERRLRVFDFKAKTVEAEFALEGNFAPAANVPAVGEVNGSAVIVHTGIFRNGATPVEVRSRILVTRQKLCGEDWPQFKRSARRDAVQRDRAPWSPFACARPFVEQQYQDLLGRGIDTGGLEFWTARLRSTWTGPRVVNGFMNSAEFLGVAAPVVRMTIGVRAGPPGPASDIRAGMATLQQDPSATEAVAAQILASAPARTDEQLFDVVWPRLTSRVATPAERSRELAAMAANGQAQWLADLAATGSAVNNLKSEVQVAMTYVGLLDRAPDSGGFSYWVGQVDGGTSPQRLIEQFLNSAEYRNRFS